MQRSRHKSGKRRHLNFEALEDRCLLDAAPLGTADQYSLLQDRSLVLQAQVSSTTTSAELSSLQLVNSISVNSSLKKLDYSAPYRQVAGILSSSRVSIYDQGTGQEVSALNALKQIIDLDFTPDGRYLFVSDFGGERTGYGTPLTPSYVHRYDMLTKTWETKIISGIAYHIEAVDQTRFLLKTSDQHEDITLQNFGATAADPVTQLAITSSNYGGDFEYRDSTGLIYHGSVGTSSPDIEISRLTGNSLQSVTQLKINGGPTSTLSADGTRFYFGSQQILTDTNTVSHSLGESILAGAGNIAFGKTSFWNTLTGTKLGTYPVDFEAITVSDDQKTMWGYDDATRTLYQYRIPGALPSVLANDTDPDGQPLTAEIVSPPAHGSVLLQASGLFSYTPAAGYYGQDQFTYRAFDGANYSSPVTVNLTIWPYLTNTAGSANYTTNEDTSLLVSSNTGLLKGVLAADGTPLTVRLETGPSHGQLSLQADGSFQYIPAANYNGYDQFTYRVLSNTEASPVGTYRLFVNAVADAPVTNPDTYRIFEDQAITLDWRVNENTTAANFTGIKQIQKFGFAGTMQQMEFSAAYNILAVRDAQKITLINAGNANVIATLATAETFSDMDFSSDGRYLFVADFGGETAGEATRPNRVQRYDIETGTWVSKVAPRVAYRIEAIDAQKFLLLDQLQNVELTLNDFGSTPATAITELDRMTQPSMYQGDIEYSAVTNRVYYANSNISPGKAYWFDILNDKLNYWSGTTLSNTGSATLSDDARYFYSTKQQIDIAGNNISRTFPFSIVSAMNNLAISSENGYIYNALNGLLYGYFFSNPSTIGTDESGTTLWFYSNFSKEIAGYHMPGSFEHPAVNDSDADGDALEFSILTTVSQGTLTPQADGSLRYIPPAGFSGTETFTYKVTDPAGNSSMGTATIIVQAVDDAPLAGLDTYATIEETSLTVSAAQGVLLNDSDPEGASLSITGVNQPANGTVSLAADGSFVYTPKIDFYGIDSFTYTIWDGTVYGTGTVNINVSNTPDAPVAYSESFAGTEDVAMTASSSRNILSNDVDVDGDTLSAILVSAPAVGSFTLNSNGTFTYMPQTNFSGNVSFTYRVFDGYQLSNIATATLTISAVNDAPNAASDRYAIVWGASSVSATAATGVLANDTDIDSTNLTAILVTPPQNGILVFNPDGSFTYTKNAGFTLADSFTYRARDAFLNSAITTVSIELGIGRIDVGSHVLLANTPNQQISLYMTGSAPLNGMNLRLQLGDGLNSIIEPIITAVDYTDTIWTGFPKQIIGGPVEGAQQFVQSSVVFDAASSSVIGNGKVVTLTVDTTGIYFGSYAFALKGTQIGADSDLIVAGTSTATPLFTSNGSIIVKAATVTSRQTFYNNSYFDGFDSAITPADLAAGLATDKKALLPGQAATFANYTSYSKGINGIVLEVENIQYQPQLDEFEFRTGNNTTPGSWTLMTVAPTITVETLAAGKVRIYFTWPDNTITKKWLEVLVKAKGPMGLPLDDVFYFGNAVGEIGNQTGNTFVDGTDFAYTRDNKHNFLNRATITDPADFNRDSLVDATDLIFTRDNSTNFISALKLFTPPAHVTPSRTPYVPPSMGLMLDPGSEQQNLAPASALVISQAGSLGQPTPQASLRMTPETAIDPAPKLAASAPQTPENLEANYDVHAFAYAQWMRSPVEEAIDGLLPGIFRKKLVPR
jgi:hypothetical protein